MIEQGTLNINKNKNNKDNDNNNVNIETKEFNLSNIKDHKDLATDC